MAGKAINEMTNEQQREAARKEYLNEKVTVVVTKPDNVRGETDTSVTVNGKIFQIMYDTPVEVPRYVAEVIQHSREMQAVISEIKEKNRATSAAKKAIAEL